MTEYKQTDAGVTGGGWICDRCHLWVTQGNVHNCPMIVPFTDGHFRLDIQPEIIDLLKSIDRRLEFIELQMRMNK